MYIILEEEKVFGWGVGLSWYGLGKQIGVRRLRRRGSFPDANLELHKIVEVSENGGMAASIRRGWS